MVSARWTKSALIAGLAILISTASSESRAEEPEDAGVTKMAEMLHGIRIRDGERVVLTIAGGASVSELSRGPAPKNADAQPLATDTRVEALFQAPTAPSTAAPDTLVASFENFGTRGATLRVENGYGHPIIYDASIVTRRGENLVITSTSICPVAAKKVGTEGWGGAVVGVILSNPHEPSGDQMRCSGESGLVSDTTPPNQCSSDIKDSPVQVQLAVDPSTGERRNAQAEWILHDPAGGPYAPWLILGFPMQNDVVADRPIRLQVLAIAGLDHPSTAKTASIAVRANDAEVVRRPWELYASRMSGAGNVPDGSKPVGFVGVIPFPLQSGAGSTDLRLADLFAAIGDGQVKQVEVRVEGDDGSLIGHGMYSLAAPAVRNSTLVTTALRDAEAKNTSPGHCAKPAAQAR